MRRQKHCEWDVSSSVCSVSCTMHNAHNGVMSFVMHLLNTCEGLNKFVSQFVLCRQSRSIDRVYVWDPSLTWFVLITFIVHLLDTCEGLRMMMTWCIFPCYAARKRFECFLTSVLFKYLAHYSHIGQCLPECRRKKSVWTYHEYEKIRNSVGKPTVEVSSKLYVSMS
jgi:hypothetical protein